MSENQSGNHKSNQYGSQYGSQDASQHANQDASQWTNKLNKFSNGQIPAGKSGQTKANELGKGEETSEVIEMNPCQLM